MARRSVPGGCLFATTLLRPTLPVTLPAATAIVDFLADEVISRQPEPIHQFLMRTPVLSRFTAPLCDAVTGTVNARDIIDKLERENLFLIARDDKREWFRYHHLFAQLLLGQLDRAEPGAIAALHQRVSAWYLERGSADEAIGHALAAGDFTRSATLIAQHWYRYTDAGRVATVRSWIRSLGDDNISTSPLAAHSAACRAAGRTRAGRVAAAGQAMSHPPGVIPAGPGVSRVILRYRTIRRQTVSRQHPHVRWTGTCWLLVIGSLARDCPPHVLGHDHDRDRCAVGQDHGHRTDHAVHGVR